MKLPQIKYTKQVTTLGRENIYGPLRQAGAVSQALESVTGAVQDMYARHIELRGQSIDLATQKEDSEIRAEHGSKQFWDANDIPADLEVETTMPVIDQYGETIDEPRTQIPRYEVWPQFYRSRMAKVIKAQSERMPNEKVREKWYSDKMAKLDLAYADIMTKANIQQEKFQQDLTLANAADAAALGLFDKAHLIISNLKDPLLRKEMHEVYNIEEETNDYDQAITEANSGPVEEQVEALPLLYADLEILTQPFEEYRNTGFLDIRNKRLWAEKIQGEIWSLERRLRAANKVNTDMLRLEASAMIEVYKSSLGKEISPGAYDKMIRDLNQVSDESGIRPLMTKLRYARIYSQMGYLDEDSGKFYHFTAEPPQVQGAIVEAIHAKVEKDDVFGLQAILFMRKAVTASQAARDNNIHEWVFNNGIVSRGEYPELRAPNPAKYGSEEHGWEPGYLTAYFKALRNPAKRFFEATGSHEGFMTGNTAKAAVEYFSALTDRGRIAAFSEIVEGTGDGYANAFQQLYDHGLKGSWAIAGIVGRSNPLGAEKILEGQRRLESDFLWLPQEIKEGLNEYIREIFTDAYPRDYSHKMIMVEGFKAGFVSLLEEQDVKDDDWGDVAKKADLALQMIGGLVEYNGSVVMPPHPGITQDDWEAKLKTTSGSELKNMNNGAIAIDTQTNMPFDPMKLMNLIKSGPNTIVEDGGLLGGNRYPIIHEGRPVLSSEGLPYVYKYIDDPRTREHDRKDEIKEQTAKELEGYTEAYQSYIDKTSPQTIQKYIDQFFNYLREGREKQEGYERARQYKESKKGEHAVTKGVKKGYGAVKKKTEEMEEAAKETEGKY